MIVTGAGRVEPGRAVLHDVGEPEEPAGLMRAAHEGRLPGHTISAVDRDGRAEREEGAGQDGVAAVKISFAPSSPK